MSIKEGSDEDQTQVYKALDLILELSKLNPEIHTNIWISSFFRCIAYSYLKCGASYESFCEDMGKAAITYKPWWEDD